MRADLCPMSLERRQRPVGTGTQGKMAVQTVLFPSDWPESKVKFWLKEHDYKYSNLDKTEGKWRARQFNPEHFEEKSFRTKEIDKGVQIVTGRLKATREAK